jgi:hypothetical protein
MIFLAAWLTAVIAGIVHVSVRRLWGQSLSATRYCACTNWAFPLVSQG